MSEQNTHSIQMENDHQLPTLYEVSLQGDVVGLRRLIQGDALALERVSVVTRFNETPLHIAAMCGHSDFAREILTLKPQLASELDSLHRTPLHWACEKGFTEIVIKLLQTNSVAALLPDHEGRVPLHLAVMKTRNDVVSELVRSRPDSIKVKAEDGGTILHLCVKYNNLEALKLLVETAKGCELGNASDDHGNTILHIAVIYKQVEITKYLLLDSMDINKNALNTNGFTPLDTANHSSADSKALEIKILLLEAGVDSNHPSKAPEPAPGGCLPFVGKCKSYWNRFMRTFEKRLEHARGNVLVAATVTASIAFQAGINPPDFKDKTRPVLFGGVYTSAPDSFWLFNSLSLACSLMIILLMQSGVPFRNNKFTSVLSVVGMGFTVVSIAATYYFAVVDSKKFQGDPSVIEGFYIILEGVFCLIIILHVLTLAFFLFFKIVKYFKKLIVCLCIRKVVA